MATARLLAFLAALVGCAAAFLPWVTARYAESVSGTRVIFGWVTLAVFAAECTLILGTRRERSPTAIRLVLAGCSAFVLFVTAVFWLVGRGLAAEALAADGSFQQFSSFDFSFDVGWYATILCAVAVIAFVAPQSAWRNTE